MQEDGRTSFSIHCIYIYSQFQSILQAFVHMLEKEKRPLLTNDSELDGLVSEFGQILDILHLPWVSWLVGGYDDWRVVGSSTPCT